MAKQKIESTETYLTLRNKLNAMYEEIFGVLPKKANIGDDGLVTEIEIIDIDGIVKGLKVEGVQKYNLDSTRLMQVLDSPLRALIASMIGSSGSPKTLTSINIQGPESVNEGTSSTYLVMGSYSDGTTGQITTGIVWSNTKSYAITNGQLVVPSNVVTGDGTSTTISAVVNGLSDSQDVAIVDTSTVVGGNTPAPTTAPIGAHDEMSANFTRDTNNFVYSGDTYGGVDFKESFPAGAEGFIQMDLNAVGKGAIIVSGIKGIHGSGGMNSMSMNFGSNGANILVARYDNDFYPNVANLSLANSKARIRVTATQYFAEYSTNGGASWSTLAASARTGKSYITIFSDFPNATVTNLVHQGLTL